MIIKNNFVVITFLIGLILIFASYLFYYIFPSGFTKCGTMGSSWFRDVILFFIPVEGSFAICIPGAPIPSPLSFPLFWLGLAFLIASIILYLRGRLHGR